MNTTIITNQSSTNLMIPIEFIFWGYVIAYIIHIIDEALMGETFVGMVRNSFWPEYEWKHFFGFNALLMSLTVISVILFESFHGLWIIAPLSLVFLFVTNGIWHLFFTIIMKRYSPGLLTSLIYWILFYFLFKYSFIKDTINMPTLVVSGAIGTLLTVSMIGSLFIFKRKFK